MKIFTPIAAIIFLLTMGGCQKSVAILSDAAINDSPNDSGQNISPGDKILVDASKDGGVWWFPQAGSFDANQPHQGQGLANLLRSMGYEVDELPRDAVITDELLKGYSKIIRGPAFFQYSNEELEAYKKFFDKPGAMFLLQDHLSYCTNDLLSEWLGLNFKGAVSGTITKFADNEITNGVGNLPFIAGSVVINTKYNPGITVLGYLKGNEYSVLNNSYPLDEDTGVDLAVMGTLNSFPDTRIFFLGDSNGIEGLPEPLTSNIINWLFK